MKPYQILVTGAGISGKSNLAKRLEEDLSKEFSPVISKDVDWDDNALVVPENALVYILQTPKGHKAEQEHGISLGNFNKILYSDPGMETYIKLITCRGCAWFREGVVEKGLDMNPKPYSPDKLPGIFERILGYALRKERLRGEDLNYFMNPELAAKVIVLKPTIENPHKLSFESYDATLEQIVKEVRIWEK